MVKRASPKKLPPRAAKQRHRSPVGLPILRAGETYDIIISDVMMPAMTGAELYREVFHSHPDLAARMVFMSGGATTPDAKQFLSAVDHRCVRKPFHATELRDFIVRHMG